jgi:hypothetical protein
MLGGDVNVRRGRGRRGGRRRGGRGGRANRGIARAVAHHPQLDINPADDSGEEIVDGAQENDQQAGQDDGAFNMLGVRAAADAMIDGASDHEDDLPARPVEDFDPFLDRHPYTSVNVNVDGDPNQQLNYQFELSREKPKSLESLIRHEIQPLIKELSSKQNDKNESFLAVLGQDLILDSLDFRPKDVINSIGLGSHLQLNRSYLLNPSSSNNFWYYSGGGIMFRNIDTYLTDKNDTLTLAPFISVSLSWITEKQNWIQPDFGLRFGYNYSHRKTATACNASVKWEPGALCRSTFFQPTLSISFLKLIRFEIGNVLYTKNFGIKDATYLFQVSF